MNGSSKDTKDKKENDELLNGKYYVRPGWVQTHSASDRQIRGSLTVVLKVFAICWGLFYSMDGLMFGLSKEIRALTRETPWIDAQDIMPFAIYLMVDQVLTSNFFLSKEKHIVDYWTLKSLSCSAIGMMLVAVATVNPSCSVLLALPLVPTLLGAAPQSTLARLWNAVVSPTGLFLLYYAVSQFVLDQDPSGFYRSLMEKWWVHGSIAYPIIFCLYYPGIVLARVLSGMPVQTQGGVSR